MFGFRGKRSVIKHSKCYCKTNFIKELLGFLPETVCINRLVYLAKRCVKGVMLNLRKKSNLIKILNLYLMFHIQLSLFLFRILRSIYKWIHFPCMPHAGWVTNLPVGKMLVIILRLIREMGLYFIIFRKVRTVFAFWEVSSYIDFRSEGCRFEWQMLQWIFTHVRIT